MGGEGGAIPVDLSDDGTYRVAIPFKGEAKVTVSTEHLNTKGGGADNLALAEKQKQMFKEQLEKMPPEMRQQYENLYGGKKKEGGQTQKYVEIPGKYSDPKRSPLAITVQGGSQVEDFTLTK
jgi:hypothetical protein